MANKLIKFFIFVILLISLASCATPRYKLYEGNDLPPEQIAVLINSGAKNLAIYINQVDGKAPPESGTKKSAFGSKLDGSCRIELSPGQHTLSVSFAIISQGDIKGFYPVENQSITFNAEAGKIYLIKGLQDSSNNKWKGWVEQVSSVAPQKAESTKSSNKGKDINSVRIKFDLPKGKVSNVIDTLNYLQSKFNKLEITIRAEDGQLTNQEYKDKIEEYLKHSGIIFVDVD
jgi:hypothetical protein